MYNIDIEDKYNKFRAFSPSFPKPFLHRAAFHFALGYYISSLKDYLLLPIINNRICNEYELGLSPNIYQPRAQQSETQGFSIILRLAKWLTYDFFKLFKTNPSPHIKS